MFGKISLASDFRENYQRLCTYINLLLVPDLPSHIGMAPDVEYWDKREKAVDDAALAHHFRILPRSVAWNKEGDQTCNSACACVCVQVYKHGMFMEMCCVVCVCVMFCVCVYMHVCGKIAYCFVHT